MNSIKRFFREIAQYPSAVIGMVFILGLVVFSIYTVIALPYDEAISLWRGDENAWYKTPKNAQPKWMNWFLKEDLPETLSYSTVEMPETKEEVPLQEAKQILISFPFDYNSEIFPQELTIFFKSK